MFAITLIPVPCWHIVPTAKVKASAAVMRRNAGSGATRASDASAANSAAAAALTPAAASHTPRLNGSKNTFDTADCAGCRKMKAPLPCSEKFGGLFEKAINKHRLPFYSFSNTNLFRTVLAVRISLITFRRRR